MKKLFAVGMVTLALTARVTWAAISVDVSFQMETATEVRARGSEARGDVLNVKVRMHGIEAGDCFRYAFVWKSPQPEVFRNSEYVVSKPAGECEFAHLQCYCADTKEKGCWRASAYRTISGEWNGKVHRATGAWTVEIWRVSLHGPNQRVKLVEKLGNATYRVK